MTYNIIGWYGTETMGDIAILDGIIRVITRIDNCAKILIGSLYPFYTYRTIFQEKEIFRLNSDNLKFEVYDIKDSKIRKYAIDSSDRIIIGGGPLMGFHDLKILRCVFCYAKKKNIPRIIMGCGVGPIYKKEYIKVLKDIVNMATHVSYRDKYSLYFSNELCPKKENVKVLGDPAVISIENYKLRNKEKNIESYIAINLREYPQNEYGKKSSLSYNKIQMMLEILSKKFEKVKMIPMHTFFIGGDDRFFFSKILNSCRFNNIEVLHDPINLYELYSVFTHAKACVGMRYHSIVMQTILNGNNIILDYTDPQNGKIQGFISEIDFDNFYKERKINIQNNIDNENILNVLINLNNPKKFEFLYSGMEDRYIEFLKKIN